MRKLSNLVIASGVLALGSSLSFEAQAQSDFPYGNIVISEYVEGTQNNQAVELTNIGDSTFDMGQAQCELHVHTSAGAAHDKKTFFEGVILAPGEKLVIVNQAAQSAELRAKADRFSDKLDFDGNDGLMLVCFSQGRFMVDVFGQIAMMPDQDRDPGPAGWGSAPNNSTDRTLRRKASVTQGRRMMGMPFDPVNEWDSFPVDTFDGLGRNAGAPAPLGGALPLLSLGLGLGGLSLRRRKGKSTPAL